MSATAPHYLRAVGLAVLQAGASGVWIAVRDLPPARRRLTRLGTVAALAAVSWAATPDKPGTDREDAEIVLAERPFPVSDPPPAEAGDGLPDITFDKKKALLAAGVLGLSVAAFAGRRKLERHWLARLTRDDHPNPTRGLAVRMATVEFAGHLAMQLVEARREIRGR